MMTRFSKEKEKFAFKVEKNSEILSIENLLDKQNSKLFKRIKKY